MIYYGMETQFTKLDKSLDVYTGTYQGERSYIKVLEPDHFARLKRSMDDGGYDILYDNDRVPSLRFDTEGIGITANGEKIPEPFILMGDAGTETIQYLPVLTPDQRVALMLDSIDLVDTMTRAGVIHHDPGLHNTTLSMDGDVLNLKQKIIDLVELEPDTHRMIAYGESQERNRAIMLLSLVSECFSTDPEKSPMAFIGRIVNESFALRSSEDKLDDALDHTAITHISELYTEMYDDEIVYNPEQNWNIFDLLKAQGFCAADMSDELFGYVCTLVHLQANGINYPMRYLEVSLVKMIDQIYPPN